MVLKNNYRNCHNLIQFQSHQKGDQEHSRKCLGRIEWRNLGKYVSTPENLWRKKTLKKTWKLESLWAPEIKGMKSFSKQKLDELLWEGKRVYTFHSEPGPKQKPMAQRM